MKHPPAIQIFNRHPRSRTSPHFLKNNVARIFKLLKLDGVSVEITLCDDRFMRGENVRHMKKTGTTDVLSFPQLTPQKSMQAYQKKFLGDILVSLDQARLQAKLQNIALRREVLFLILHSILHLLGHDHARAREKTQMQKLESQIWTKLTDKSKG